METPNPWQSMEPWRRVALLGTIVVIALSYVARAEWDSTDAASRIAVVIACLVALALWSKRPRP